MLATLLMHHLPEIYFIPSGSFFSHFNLDTFKYLANKPDVGGNEKQVFCGAGRVRQ